MLSTLLSSLLFGNLCNAASLLSRQSKVDVQDWERIQPESNLNWTRCFGTRECTRLILSRDYNEPDGRKAAVAIIRVPSPLANTSQYRGPVWVNPGGPGVSGTDFLNSLGDTLQAMIGLEFDIVSFDPRGVGHTTPRASFYSSCEERSYEELTLSVTTFNSSEDALARAYADWQNKGKLAQARNVHGDLAFMSTDLVARDMLEMNTAYGFDKLSYWGFSYGAGLGSTFAAMFPDKIERMILDGVGDNDEYRATRWGNNLKDTDKAMQIFIDRCASSSPQRCALHATRAESIRQTIDDLYTSLRKTPVPVFIPATNTTLIVTGIVDYATVKKGIFNGLRNPDRYPAIAQALFDLTQGDATNAFLQFGARPLDCTNGVPNQNDLEAVVAIACGDGDSIVDEPVEKMRQHYQDVAEEFSAEFSEAWPTRLFCSGWRVRPASRFTAPFAANTSHPILFLANTADTVTSHAEKVSLAYPGSMVLTLDTPGHTTLAASSTCIAGHIREYFINGTLPAAGTICARDAPLFPPTA